MTPATSATSAEAVLQDRRGAGLWLTLNRPERLNGLSPEIIDGLLGGLDEAERDPDVRALVIAANGRAFCAGADLEHIKGLQAREGTALPLLREVSAMFDRFERSPVPIVGVCAGLAAGGGFELLQVCDLVLMGDGARLADAHANFGLIPGGGSTARLARLIGPQRAKQLIFTGEFLTARRAWELGFGNEVVPDDQLIARAEALVATLAQKSGLMIGRCKALVGDALAAPVPVGVRAELLAVELHEHSFDQREGVAAFNEKRAPRFEGR